MSSIKWFNETDSTNNQIVNDKKSLEDKSVYATLFQTSGRGQRGNVWTSQKGDNLLFTILFKPNNIASKRQFIISQAVTLGVVDYLDSYGIKATIKWPNDIYVNDLKICGILIENTIMGDKLADSIVGIGLNVNQKIFEGLPNPTSIVLEKHTDERFEVYNELPKILTNIFYYYDIIDTRSELIEQSYLNKMYRKGSFHRYIDINNNVEFEGKIIGIDSSSCLLVEYRNGEIRRFAFKEISYVLK